MGWDDTVSQMDIFGPDILPLCLQYHRHSLLLHPLMGTVFLRTAYQWSGECQAVSQATGTTKDGLGHGGGEKMEVVASECLGWGAAMKDHSTHPAEFLLKAQPKLDSLVK